ncbi:ABC transporter ATP-binding protein [Paenibacillus radicis (ex Gao et al. 2016)]|uniref:ABC transporter ATP-binding protein n=1 Tax=Paenibacillus radicis (ex Gao et al. 2016) TaxID=1737354 RepID=A0A917MA80_9BACL|nr:ABC transporter ATP-binding protein [Paenibacillus radicis (ex Gao et al. 2016)]GGG88889.1 ABC transporter ATP-binding protein [Paenibacillus radicis (ex Gao et al. 2016)]
MADDHRMLELIGVSHVYVNDKGASLAVEQLDIAVHRGEFVSLVGPSGCGKTTILSMLAGLIPPTRGQVLLGGDAVSGPSTKVGYMLQQDFLFPWRTIRDNAAIGLEITGRKTPEALRRVDELLAELGLPGSGSRYPHELSGGMRQRVALARTLATEPDILLLDEPFSALDLHIKLQLEDLVQQTLRRLGKTAMLVTHDLAEAAAMSDRVIVLAANPGRIVAEHVMPDELRSASPMDARRLAGFQSIFDQLWAELEAAEGAEGGDADE